MHNHNFKHKKTGRVIASTCMPKIPKQFTNSTHFEPTTENITHKFDDAGIVQQGGEMDDSYINSSLLAIAVEEVIEAVIDTVDNSSSYDNSSTDFGGGDTGGGGAGSDY